MATFTSSEEFDIERRVWMTNEIPPYDLFKSLHSAMQTPFWEWILGTTTVGYDYPYEVLTEKGYVRDLDSDELYLKMTNGLISENYGPNKKGSIYNRLEIDGVLMPEFDLLLHEVYRYTETLYPDHPDERFLLTDNELNDTILAAGDLINYTPNIEFFEKVAKTLSQNTNKNEIFEEATKLKIRNLLNEAFRRKLYGTKAGYRMLANDIFQKCTVYPVATYIPIEDLDKSLLVRENNTINDKSILNKLNLTKIEYDKYVRENNRKIDIYSPLYYRKFKLIDWNGQNSSYDTNEFNTTEFYGFTIPFNESRIYEYPNEDFSYIKSLKVGSFFKNKDDDKSSIIYVTDKSSDDIHQKQIHAVEESNNYYCEERVDNTNTVSYIETSSINKSVYADVFLYENVKYYLDKLNTTSLKNYRNFLNHRYSEGHELDKTKNYFELLLNIIKQDSITVEKPSILKCILNPYIRDTVFLEPKYTLDFYPDDVSLERKEPEFFYLKQDEILDKHNLFGKLLGNINIIDQASEADRLSELYYITGFTKGFVNFKLENNIKVTTKPKMYELDSRYAIAVEARDGNIVVLIGKAKPYYDTIGGENYLREVKFEISCIPNKKSDSLMQLCYPETRNIINERDLIASEYKIYTDSGLTISTCEELIHAFNEQVVKEIEIEQKLNGLYKIEEHKCILDKLEEIKNSDLEVARGSKFYIKCNDVIEYFYKSNEEIDSKPIILKFKTSNYSMDEICSAYKEETGKDYSNFIYKYIEYKAKCEILEKYEKNREYITIGNILPKCKVLHVFECGFVDNKKLFSPHSTLIGGIIDELSFGNLNIAPLIHNTIEYEKPYNISKSGNIEIFAKKAKKYSNLGIDIHYYEPLLYSECKRRLESDTIGNDAISRENTSVQLYSKLPVIQKNNQKHKFALYKNDSQTANNIVCTAVKISNVEIESVIDLSTEESKNKIFFKGDLAKKKCRSISVGDRVFGPSLDTDDNDILVTYVGYNYVIVNTKLQQPGTFILTFKCKLNIDQVDVYTDLSSYKKYLNDNNLYVTINPFNNGLWGSRSFPNASNAILESLPDIIFYKPYNLIYNKSKSLSSFNEVMSITHGIPAKDKVLCPSTIKFFNDLFIEYNIYKYTNQQTRSGVSPSLMTVDWLDYISSNLDNISRATDKTNVGINLVMETDATGYFTLDQRIKYTDPNVMVKFITMNLKKKRSWLSIPHLAEDKNWTVPVYAQIGTGGRSRLSWFMSPTDITYPTIWGNSVYDSENILKDEVDAIAPAGGRIKRRSVWGIDSHDSSETEISEKYNSVENMLFEIPLGEYDVQTRYLPSIKSDISRATTTVQASFYKESFENISKYLCSRGSCSQTLVINSNESYISSPIDTVEGIDILTYSKVFIPETKQAGEFIEIKYPELKNSNEYYIINENYTKSDIGQDLKTVKFYEHSILTNFLIDTKEWADFQFEFVGLFGKNKNVSLTEIYGRDNLDMRYSMLQRIIQANGFGSLSKKEDIKNLFNGPILKSKKDYNKIFWFIYIGPLVENTTDIIGKSTIKEGDIIGIAVPKLNTDIENLKLIKFNKCYFINTLKVERNRNVSDTEYSQLFSGKFAFINDIKKSITEIKLPRKCITEGSYNLEYVINPDFTSSGYKYIEKNESPVDLDSTKYFVPENKTLADIDKSEEINFTITRSKIYKDEKNNEFYTYTDTINGQPQDVLKKVALKFEDNKYFKNTLFITGSYKLNKDLQSGSNTVNETATISSIAGINEFNSSYLASGDRILQVAPVSLRSIWEKGLESIFFSNYKNFDAEIIGIDDNKNLVLSYDHTSEATTLSKLNFIFNVKLLAPVKKTISKEKGVIIEHFSEKYYNFLDPTSKFSPPRIKFNKVTKSLIGGTNISGISSKANFKFFKNLLLTRVTIPYSNPDQIYPADNDSGQFKELLTYVNNNDEVINGTIIRGDLGKENISQITFVDKKGGQVKISYTAYDQESKKFMGISHDGIAYFANDVEITSHTEIEVESVVLDNLTSSTTKVVGLSFDKSDPNNPIWIITTGNGIEKNDRQCYSIPFNYTKNSENKIVSSAVFGTAQPATAKVPDNTLIQVSKYNSLTFNKEKNEGEAKEVEQYVKAKDYAVASIEQDGDKKRYINKPFVTHDLTKLQYKPDFIYEKDNKSDFAVYLYNKELFIKSPSTVCTKDGKYTNDITSQHIWKHSQAKITRNVLRAEIESKCYRKGEQGAYEFVHSRWQDFKNNWAFLLDVDLEANNNDLERKLSGPDFCLLANPDFSKIDGNILTEEKYRKWKDNIEKYVGRNLKVREILYYQIFIKQAMEILPISWNYIQEAIKTAKSNKNKSYYLFADNESENNVVFKTETDRSKLVHKNGHQVKDYIEVKAVDDKVVINHYGARFSRNESIATINGEELKVPYFYDIDIREPQKLEKTSVIKDEFEYQWYIDYLHVVDSCIYLDMDFENLFLTKIKKVLFTDDKILFVLDKSYKILFIKKENTYKTEDIDNLENWHIIDQNDMYGYAYPDYNNTDFPITKKLHFTKSKQDYSLDFKLSYLRHHRRIYDITTFYSDNNVILLGGSIKSMKAIEQEYARVYSPEDLKDENYKRRLKDNKYMSVFEDFSYPILFYSLNGGLSFSASAIPLDLPCCKRLKSGGKVESAESSVYRDAYKNPEASIQINSIHFIDGKYKLGLLDVTNNKTVNYELFPKEKDGNYDWSELTYKQISPEEIVLNTGYEEQYDKFKLFMYNEANYINRATPFDLKIGNSIVLNTSESFIKLNKAITQKTDSGGSVQVLLVIKTAASVSLQAQLRIINKFAASEYLNGGQFKFKNVVEVDSIEQADAFYNYRETLTNEERLKIDEGYRAVSEDEEHKFYSYTTYDENGTLKYNLDVAKNINKQNILLCDDSGNYIHNTGTKVYHLQPDDLLASDFNPLVLQSAGKPIYPTLLAAEKDKDLRVTDKLFAAPINPKLASINFNDSDTEKIIQLNGNVKLVNGMYLACFKIKDSEELKYEILSEEQHKNSTYKPKYKTFDNINNIPLLKVGESIKYVGPELLIADSSVKIRLLEDDIKNYKKYLIPVDRKDVLEAYIHANNSTIDSIQEFINKYYTTKRIDNSSDEFFFNTMYNVFPITNKRYINIDVYPTYSTANGQLTYTNRGFFEIEEKDKFKTPITSIYIPQKGYGGLRLRDEKNNSWKYDLPWTVDPAAFSNEYLKNEIGENVTLSDELGNTLISNNGESKLIDNLSYSVDFNDVKEGSFKEIEVFSLNGVSKKVVSSVKLYKPYKAKANLWTSTDTININENSTDKQILCNVNLAIPSQFLFRKVENYTMESYDSIVAELENDKSVYKEIFNKIKSNIFVEESKDGVNWVYSKNVNIENSILTFTQDKNAGIPKYIKILYKENRLILEKVISVEISENENIFYDKLSNAIFYKKEADEKVIINKAEVSLSNKSIITLKDYLSYDSQNKVFSSSKNNIIPDVSESIDIEINSIITKLNIPIFFIGHVKQVDFKYNNSNTTIFCIDDNIIAKPIFKKEENSKVEVLQNGTKCDICKFHFSTLEDNTNILLPNPKIFIENNLYRSDSKISIKAITNKQDLYINNVVSEVLVRKPLYNTFNDLIINLGYIASGGNVYYDYKKHGNIETTFNAVNSNIVSLTKPLNSEELNDGNEHYIRLRLLTQSSIAPVRETCNLPDYYIELDNNEIDKFTPDRAYFNPNGYPSSPVRIGNKIYNEANNQFFTKSNFINTNNVFICECDKDGNYIKYFIKDGKLAKRVLNSFDNLSDTFVPLTPNYLTCKSWFESEFYVKGSESNPFWQILKLKPVFNSNLQKWFQVAEITQYEKNGLVVKQIEVGNGEKYFNIHKGSVVEVDNGFINQKYNCDFLDLTEGVMRFYLTQPDDKYLTNKRLIKYGIAVENSFYNKDFKQPVKYSGYLNSSYTVNSRKNFANITDSDSSIVEITEFGLLDKDRNLIAYAVFPPIEYRTDSQHISFTCFIKSGQCDV